MHVIVYMLYAEAVVALAAGTVTEFEVGVAFIGFAADRALVSIRLIAAAALLLLCGITVVRETRTPLSRVWTKKRYQVTAAD